MLPAKLRALLQTDDPTNIRLAVTLAEGLGIPWTEHWSLLRLLERQGALPKASYTTETLLHFFNQITELHFDSSATDGLLPPALLHFLNLKKLIVRETELTELPEWLDEWSGLEVVQCVRTGLSYLPEELGRAQTLQQLLLPHNQLTRLPECLGHLTQLQRLDVSYNPLRMLPDALEDLDQLQELYLSGLNWTVDQLPPSIQYLSQLRALHLSNNRLTALPHWIGTLPALKVIYLRGNPIEELPASLLNSSTIEVIY